MTKKPAVGITNYYGELDLSDFDIALPEQSPQPELIKDLPLFVADESKILMVAAKDLEARLEKLCKALTAEYKVKYPIRYKFKVKNTKAYQRSHGIALFFIATQTKSSKKRSIERCIETFFIRNALGDPAVFAFAR